MAQTKDPFREAIVSKRGGSSAGSLTDQVDKFLDGMVHGAAGLLAIVEELSDGDEDESPAEFEYDVLEDLTEAMAKTRAWVDGLLDAAGLPETTKLPGEDGEDFDEE